MQRPRKQTAARALVFRSSRTHWHCRRAVRPACSGCAASLASLGQPEPPPLAAASPAKPRVPGSRPLAGARDNTGLQVPRMGRQRETKLATGIETTTAEGAAASSFRERPWGQRTVKPAARATRHGPKLALPPRPATAAACRCQCRPGDAMIMIDSAQ
jgi:hypothetical protein